MSQLIESCEFSSPLTLNAMQTRSSVCGLFLALEKCAQIKTQMESIFYMLTSTSIDLHTNEGIPLPNLDYFTVLFVKICP